MPLFRHFINTEYQWGIWKAEESLDDLLGLLPGRGEMHERELESFASPNRKMEWLAVRVLLYSLLGKEKKICYHPGGKPYLADNSAHISISHTKGYVAVIVSPAKEVGIDIETRGERIHRVAHKFAHPDEHAQIEPAELTVTLLLIWSAKEVLFKCLNVENVNFRDHFRTDPFPINQFWMTAHETCTPQERSFLIHYILHEDFVMTWTVC